MIIINSGSYITSEFQSEIGKLPPCLLPIGNKKLIEHQVNLLSKYYSEDIFVTLPEDFELYLEDKNLFKRLNIDIIWVDSQWSLAESVLVAISTIALTQSIDSPVRMLHGDTLLYDFPRNKDDLLGVGKSSESYPWQVENDIHQFVWCGYFSFSSITLLLQCLAINKHDFVAAVNMYRSKCNVEQFYFEEWLDLGHINTYFKSRAKLTTQRSFNHLEIYNNQVKKSGCPSVKIEAEAKWFVNIPVHLKRFVPQLISYNIEENNTFYQLEYLPLLPLNELFVHGRKEPFSWLNIAEQIDDFLHQSKINSIRSRSNSIYFNIEDEFRDLVIGKTYQRLDIFTKQYDFDIQRQIVFNGEKQPSVKDLISICIENCLSLPIVPSILHGDLCFSNILFNSRQDQLKLIDPRGITSKNKISIYGNQIYDYAKLLHSAVGLYDFIIAGKYSYYEEDKYKFNLKFSINKELLAIQDIFIQQFCREFSFQKINYLIVLLFISMIPLHKDNEKRQKAMLANAYRLFVQYSTSKS